MVRPVDDICVCSGASGLSRGPVSAENWRGNLVVTLWVSQSCPNYGETVILRAIVTNRNSAPLVVELKDQPVFDIVVGYPEKARWSADKPLTTDLTRLELKPGQSTSIEMQWVVTAPSGAYARFIDNSRYPDNPVSPNLFIYVGNCPGFGLHR